ncbi:hypothetical protein EZS27_028219, partial [termite gut metagenome]
FIQGIFTIANKQVFREAIKQFKKRNPNVIFIGYNGFGGEMENTVNPFRQTVDLRWLEIFDTLYSGDPRFSDVPMINVWRSQDLYSDHMVQQFLFNQLPLSRIDNCSFMIGTTGTCYNRGVAAWKSCLILNLARSGWLNVYHGNINLLSDDDVKWFSRVQNTYLYLQEYGKTTIIGGIPGKVMPYGYKSKSKDGTLITLTNPSQTMKEITLPMDIPCSPGRILFTDNGFKPVLVGNKIMLGAEQMVVIGYGEYTLDEYDWGIEEDIVIPQKIEQREIKPEIVDEHTLQTRINNLSNDIRVIFSQCDRNGNPVRSWGGAPPNGIRMNEFLKIRASQGDEDIPVRINYDKMIWSGLSWATGEIEVENVNPQYPLTITCWSKEGNSEYFKIEIYNTQN